MSQFNNLIKDQSFLYIESIINVCHFPEKVCQNRVTLQDRCCYISYQGTV